MHFFDWRKLGFSLLSLILLASCSFSLHDPSGGNQVLWLPGQVVSNEAGALPIEPSNAVQSLVTHLTLRQKVGQLVMTSFEGTEEPEDLKQFVHEYQVGGLLLFPRNIQNTQQLRDLTDYGNSLLQTPGLVVRLPLMWCLSEEGGAEQRLPIELGVFEAAKVVGGAYDSNAARIYGRRIGEALREVGLNTNLGPVFDRDAGGDIIAARAFSTDPVQVAALATAAMRGLQESQIISIAKHFPGIGDASISPTSGFLTLSVDYAQLLSRELIPFQNAIDNGAQMILVSNLMLPALDPDRPSSLSPLIIEDLLRDHMGFKGVVLSDEVNTAALTSRYRPGEAAVQAVLAGCDMVLVCHNRDDQVEVFEALYQACISGIISEERLNASVARIVALKQQYLLWH